jgi:hypothetical protein
LQNQWVADRIILKCSYMKMGVPDVDGIEETQKGVERQASLNGVTNYRQPTGLHESI